MSLSNPPKPASTREGEADEAIQAALRQLRPKEDKRAYLDQQKDHLDDWEEEAQTFALGYNAGVAAFWQEIEDWTNGN